MNWTLWWTFSVTLVLLALTPGPAVLFVIASGLRAGVRASIAASLGILSANAAYFALSATTLGAILIASYNVFFLVKWVGAAYLVYLGVRTFFAKSGVLGKSLDTHPQESRRAFPGGFLLQVSNPKALVFFGAILPQFLEASSLPGPQILVLGVTSVVLEFFVLLGYGLVAGKAAAWVRQPRFATWTNRMAGLILLMAGIGLALLRK